MAMFYKMLMAIASVSTNSHRQNDNLKEDQKQTASSSKEKAIRPHRGSPVTDQTNGHAEHKTNHLKRSSTKKRNSPRDANG